MWNTLWIQQSQAKQESPSYWDGFSRCSNIGNSTALDFRHCIPTAVHSLGISASD